MDVWPRVVKQQEHGAISDHTGFCYTLTLGRLGEEKTITSKPDSPGCQSCQFLSPADRQTEHTIPYRIVQSATPSALNRPNWLITSSKQAIHFPGRSTCHLFSSLLETSDWPKSDTCFLHLAASYSVHDALIECERKLAEEDLLLVHCTVPSLHLSSLA